MGLQLGVRGSGLSLRNGSVVQSEAWVARALDETRCHRGLRREQGCARAELQDGKGPSKNGNDATESTASGGCTWSTMPLYESPPMCLGCAS